MDPKKDLPAADLRTQLAARDHEISRLRAALRPFAEAVDKHIDQSCANELIVSLWFDEPITVGHLREARAAIAGIGKEKDDR